MLGSTKIVIADDMEPILLYLEKVISAEPELEIVGKAKDGKELMELVIKYKPELVITDEEMPECGGIQAVEQLNKLGVKTKYILVTGNGNCIITSKARALGILQVIKKPILDDQKFILQIKKAIEDNYKIEEQHENIIQDTKLKYEQPKKESRIKKIIDNFFQSK